MPQIRLDIFAHLHEAQLRRAETDLQRRMEKLGQQAGEDLTRGIEKAGPKIRREMNSAADATLDWTRKVEAARKAQEDHNAVLERANRLQATQADLYTQAGALTKEIADQENRVTEAKKAQEPVTRRQIELDEQHRQLRAEHSKTLKELADNAVLHTLGAEELKALRLQSADEQKKLRDLTIQKSAVDRESSKVTLEVTDAERALDGLRAAHKSTVQDLNSTEQELNKTRGEAAKIDEDIIKRNDDVERSHRRRSESLRRLIEAEGDNDRRRGGGGGGIFGGGGGGGGAGGFFRGALPGGRNPGAGVYAAAAPLAGDLAMGLVTASQSLAVLPAVAAAAGAGLLTLTIGFDGLGKALKDAGDPKKFAEDLQEIGPAAQQVALEIQFLTEGPLKDLKAAIEDSLFKGIPEKLHNLANTLLPSVKELTTGVGDAFNGMFGAFAGELTTPESLKSIHEIVNNIVTAFHALEPAVAPFVDALTKITQTGSTFLPGFATSIADAAKSFDDFITKAQQSGALQEFMTKGIDAIKVFGQELFTLGQKIYEVFGNKSPEQFKQLLDDTVDALITVGKMLEEAGRAANVFLQALQKIADAVGGYPHLFELAGAAFIGFKSLAIAGSLQMSTAFAAAGTAAGTGFAGKLALGLKGFGWAAVGAAIAIPILGELDKKVQEWTASHGGPPVSPQQRNRLIPNTVPILPFWEDRFRDWFGDGPGYSGGGGGSFGPAGTPPQNTAGSALGANGLQPAPPSWVDNAGIGPYGGPYPVPAVPDKGPKTSKTDQITAAREALGPDFGAIDPFAGTGFDPSILGGPQSSPGPGSPGGPGGVQVSPGAPGIPPLEYGTNGKPYAKPGYGYETVDQEAILEKAQKVQNDGFEIQEKAKDVEALKRSGVATQKQILEAEHELLLKKQELHRDQVALAKSQEPKWNKVGSGSGGGSGSLGPGIDPGFGIAQGLPGLADNLVRFIGSLAMAPVLAALHQMTGGKSAEETGFGAIGIAAAQGVFGPDFAGGGAPGQPSALGSGPSYAGRGAPGSALPGESARDFAHRVEMPYFQSQGLQVGDHAADQYGEHQNGAIDIMVNSLQQGQQVLQQVLSDPNAYGAIFNNATYGYGHGPTAQDYKGGHTGDPSQDHINHVHAFFKPGGQNNLGSGGGAPGDFSGLGGSSGLSSSGGVVPVFVTNLGGGGLGGGGGPAVGATPPGTGTGPQPGPGQGGLTPDQWNKIAGAEASGNWHINSGNGFSGGLQFTPSSWKLAGGEKYAPQAWQASPEDQMAAGNALFALQGAGAWPTTSKNHPEWFQPGAGSLPQTAPTGGTGFPLPTTPFNPFGPRPGPGLPDVSGTVRVPGGATSEPNSQSGIQSSFGTPQILGSGGGPGGGGPGLPDVSGTERINNRSGIVLGAPLAQGPQSMPGAPPTGTPPGPGGPPTGPPVGGPPAAPGPGAGGPVGRSQGEGGWQPNGPGAGGGGGAIGAAGEAASMGLDAIAPGAGQAAQTATKLINRTIQFGGQLAAIGVSGMMETFGLNGSALGDPSKSWFGRIVQGFAQAKPAVPTTAGGKDKDSAQAKQQQAPGGSQSGPMVNIENFVQAPNRNGMQVPQDLAAATAAAPLRRP